MMLFRPRNGPLNAGISQGGGEEEEEEEEENDI